ncbi:HRDC domain-containing protein [Deinococcus koreensis]|uniref:HRDC domain-containing protein n=1 Tax=Deinococcus koreensis TaxID=2054903 RepID=A0A2K3UVY5_9DEIO|nr:HRDC domain-containing protein [Deinococcus koreensis]PNY80697.1 hypothetical protein CVO96_04355 [Deinococcus koreensis]
MTAPLPPLRPDARLVRLHAERGDPPARLATALADLEGADWGLLLRDDRALARQLAALLGPGTLRVDARVRVNRDALAEAGLAVAALDGDWRGSRAAWLLEPGDAELERARRAGVDVIVDGTLAPGGGWLGQGAALIVYRDSATLTGHGDAPLSAVFGAGRAPEAAAPAPSDLSVAMALRDVATLPLRLARAARTVVQLAERLGGAAQAAGPTALLLAPDAAADSAAPLGGVVAAARSVPGGVLLAPGLEETDTALALLRGDERPLGDFRPAPMNPPAEARREEGRGEPNREEPRREELRREEPRRDEFRRDDRRPGRNRQDRGRQGEGRRGERPDQARPSQPDVPERFTFDAPRHDEDAATAPSDAEPMFTPPAQVEESWEPEIVYSDIAQPQVKLPIPVSSGPDAPNLGDELPDVLHQPERSLPADQPDARPDAQPDAPVAHAPAASRPAPAGRRGGRGPVEQAPAPSEAPVIIAPDLPVAAVAEGKEDPAADLSDEQAAVYARLREWRNAEAKRQEISRFIIASNATLAEIARRVPYTEADLRAVKGMGPERLRKYGDKILEVVRG